MMTARAMSRFLSVSQEIGPKEVRHGFDVVRPMLVASIFGGRMKSFTMIVSIMALAIAVAERITA